MIKESEAFWPCIFTYLLLKGIYNFWKVRGVIDGFNKFRRQIYYRAVNTAEESNSAISFHITPKGDLKHYYYIFSNPDPLVMDIKNMAGSRLGTML